MAKVKPFRDALIEQTGECMLCGASPKKPRYPVAALNQLCCHEILNGPLRDKVLDERSCIIVACWKCNGEELNCPAELGLAGVAAVCMANESWRTGQMIAWDKKQQKTVPAHTLGEQNHYPENV